MKLIVISTPTPIVPHEAALVSRMVDAGLQTFHLRRPSWSSQQHEHFLRGLNADVRQHVVLHHAHELVQPLRLKGFHFTTRSRPALPVAVPSGRTASLSLHALHELELPLAGMAYAFLSPIFDSVSKAGYQAAFDRQALPAALGRAACPVVALGGMTAATIPQAADLGFAGAAVLGGVWEADDPVAECRKLLAICAGL